MKKIISKLLIFALVLSVIGIRPIICNADKNLSDREKFVSAINYGVYKERHLMNRDFNINATPSHYEYEDETVSSEKKSGMAPYTSVKNQLPHGGCWMFGAISAAESNILYDEKYKGGLVNYNFETNTNSDPIDLSEAQGIYTFYNADKKNGFEEEYSSNDIHNLRDNYEQYLGYSGGSSPADAAMSLSADKGSALESDNAFDKEGVERMAEIAASKYNLNRFNIKSAEKLPEVYEHKGSDKKGVLFFHKNLEARDVWKYKIDNCGAIYANYFKVASTTKTLGDNDTNDMRTRYYHSWDDNDEYLYTQYQPNYWFFSKQLYGKSHIPNHVISIVGYDDNYSKYNFAERLREPGATKDKDYDQTVAKIEILKADASGRPFEDQNGKPLFDENKTGKYNKNSLTDTEFIVPKNDGTWIVKNSYGRNKVEVETNENGQETTRVRKKFEDGIMYISYYETSLTEPMSIDVEESLEQINNNEKVYDSTLTHSSISGIPISEYESKNDNSVLGLSKDTKAAEVFTSDKDMEIGQVGYWTGVENTNTTIQIYKLNGDNPEKGETLYNCSINPDFVPKSITNEYAGYHTYELPTPITVEKGEKISVVISQDDGSKSVLMCEAEFAHIEGRWPEYLLKSNVGDSYLYCKDIGEWVDLKDIDNDASENDETVGNITVKLFGNQIDNLYDVADYKSNNTYPEIDGKLFAGWFEDKSCTVPYKKKTGKAYAKFIDKDVLTVKNQWKLNDHSSLRFVSSVDSLDYKKLGFKFSGKYGNNTISETDKSIYCVYTKIKADEEELLPNAICESSNYFFTYTIKGMDGNTPSSWTVTPYYVTLDGTRVEGTTKDITYTPQTNTVTSNENN